VFVPEKVLCNSFCQVIYSATWFDYHIGRAFYLPFPLYKFAIWNNFGGVLAGRLLKNNIIQLPPTNRYGRNLKKKIENCNDTFSSFFLTFRPCRPPPHPWLSLGYNISKRFDLQKSLIGPITGGIWVLTLLGACDVIQCSYQDKRHLGFYAI